MMTSDEIFYFLWLSRDLKVLTLINWVEIAIKRCFDDQRFYFIEIDIFIKLKLIFALKSLNIFKT
jgi:hypothetical protein